MPSNSSDGDGGNPAPVPPPLLLPALLHAAGTLHLRPELLAPHQAARLGEAAIAMADFGGGGFCSGHRAADWAVWVTGLCGDAWGRGFLSGRVADTPTTLPPVVPSASFRYVCRCVLHTYPGLKLLYSPQPSAAHPLIHPHPHTCSACATGRGPGPYCMAAHVPPPATFVAPPRCADTARVAGDARRRLKGGRPAPLWLMALPTRRCAQPVGAEEERAGGWTHAGDADAMLVACARSACLGGRCGCPVRTMLHAACMPNANTVVVCIVLCCTLCRTRLGCWARVAYGACLRQSRSTARSSRTSGCCSQAHWAVAPVTAEVVRWQQGRAYESAALRAQGSWGLRRPCTGATPVAMACM